MPGRARTQLSCGSCGVQASDATGRPPYGTATPTVRRFLLSSLLAALILAGCSNREQVAALSEEAGEAEARGQTDLAVTRWSSVIRLDKKNADAYLRRAALYEMRGQHEKAIADYTEYLRLPTANPPLKDRLEEIGNRLDTRNRLQTGMYEPQLDQRVLVFCRRGTAYARLGDFTRALQDIDQAIQLKPTDPIPYVYRSEALELKGDPDQAVATLTKAIQTSPKDPTGYTYRGAYRLRHSQVEEAIADLDESLRLNPQSADALMHRGLAYLRLGELDKALEDLNEGVEVSHKGADLFAARGTVLLEKGDSAAAFADFNHALLLRPGDPMLLARRGYAQFKQGHVALALPDLEEAIRLNPAEALFYAWRASILASTNQLDRALADIEHAIALKPREPGFFGLRAAVYVKQAQYQKGIEDYEQAIALNPAAQELYNNLAWLRATCPSAESRNGAEAVRLATKAAQLTSFKLPHVVDTLAAAYAEAQDFENAVKYQKQCLQLITAENTRAQDMRKRLILYENRQPFHQAAP